MGGDAELSVRAIGFGIAVGAVLAAANVYAGLQIGFIDGGTAVIVLLAFALFGAGVRRFSAREANVAQVAGGSAAMMALAAGVVGPIPALAMSGLEVPAPAILVWSAALAVLGTVIAIPFRRGFIEVRKLAFPSGRAGGELIRKLFAEGGQRGRAVLVLAAAAAMAVAVMIARDVLGWIDPGWMLPLSVAGIPAASLGLGVGFSPLLVGLGVLVGLRVGVSLLIGAVVAWAVIAPELVHRGVATADYGAIVTWTLWPGAALMVASSLTTLALGWRDLVGAWSAQEQGGWGTGPKLAIAGSVLAILLVGWLWFDVSPLFAGLAVILAAIFTVAAMQATGETDQTPAGPLGGVTQVIVGAVGPGGVAAPLHGGGVVSGVAGHGSQMMQAWKAGEIVGSNPRALVVAQLAGVAVGAVACVIAYWLIQEAYGIGTSAMPAPPAVTWKATADAVARGTEGMPPGAPMAALIAAAAAILLTVLERRPGLRRLLPSPVAMGIAFIVPATTGATLALAAILFGLIALRVRGWYEENGAALASGLIVGEAVTGLVLAAIAVLSAT
jgi:uncharacterized oligopeptide transporter (OPT) family protein